MSKPTNDAPELSIKDGALIFTSSIYGDWDTPLSTLSLVGEYTSEDGPMMDDHFLVFVTKSGDVFEAPTSIKDISAVLGSIENELGWPMRMRLSLETDFKSRIIAPPPYADKPLYEFKSVAGGFWSKLVGGRVERILSAEARAALHQA